MSRFGRAVEKADREGQLTWTRGGTGSAGRAAVEVPAGPAPAAFEEPFAVPGEDDGWDPATAGETSLSSLLVAATEPASVAADQYRLLRTRLEDRDDVRRSRLILVTSAAVGEGKTTTSANLALTMAQESHHRVVLVEADLRRPTLAELFGVRPEPGLIDVLVGAATVDEALVAVPGHQLSLLPAGLPGARQTGLLGSPLMQRILDGLRGRFDRIVVDTAPTAVADTHVLTRLADAILLVVRAGVTPRPALERALEGMDRQRVVGVVLNDVDQAQAAYSYPGAPASGGE